MTKQKKLALRRPGCLIALITALVLLMLAIAIADLGFRYWSWNTLTIYKLRSQAEAYSLANFDGRPVCVYAVVCERRRAQLELVDDLETFDLEATKSRIWRRRFENYCEGYTANFAIEALKTAPAERDEDSFERLQRIRQNRAVWSFYADRFVAVDGHALRAFSEDEAEPCSAAKAISPKRSQMSAQ